MLPVATHTAPGTSPPRHIELSPCKGMKQDAGGHTDE